MIRSASAACVWHANQITLSGCSTGLNVIAPGNELIGLMRGLLFAGTRSLLLTLWDVNDKDSAASFLSTAPRAILSILQVSDHT